VTTTSAERPQPLAAALAIGRALGQRGLRFVHWKSNNHLAEALAGATDIDMFADPRQRDEVRACLSDMNCLEVVSRPWGRYDGVESSTCACPGARRCSPIPTPRSIPSGPRPRRKWS